MVRITRARVTVLAMIAAFGSAAFLAGRHLHRERPDAYVSVRLMMLMAQAEAAPRRQVLLIGDSIAEMTRVERLCCVDVFNAGIAGSTTRDWLGMAPDMIAATDPAMVVIAVGTNDAQRKYSYSSTAWSEYYLDLVRRAQPRAVVLVQPPHTEGGKLYSSIFRNDFLADERSFIEQLGRRMKLPVSKPAPGATVDGVHLDRRGRSAWVRELTTLCPPPGR